MNSRVNLNVPAPAAKRSGGAMLQRQHGCGDHAPVQRQLAIGASNDPLELEADRIADQVLAGPAAPGRAGPRIQRRAAQAGGVGAAPACVERVLAGAGRPLEPAVRQDMERRFGSDFSQVRVHSDAGAQASARAINANAYTAGQHIVFGAGQFAPQTAQGRRLLAHELAHTVQQAGTQPGAQAAPTVRREPKDAGVDDEPLPGGVRDVVPSVSEMGDGQLGPALADAQRANDGARAEAIEAEMEKRVGGWGTAVAAGPGPVTGGGGAVTPEVALELLNNMAAGTSPFKPELGLGGCSWFTTEGNPYTASAPAKSINVQVEISKGSAPLIFKEADLVKIFQAEAGPAAIQAEAEYRAKFNIDAAMKLSNRALKAINRTLRGLTEKRMWTRVGEQVASSASKVGEVVLEPGSDFSRTPGKFGVVADASKITLKGGTGPVVETLAKAGVSAEPAVVEAAEVLAKSMKWAGRVRGVFRYGGRVLIVVGITLDAIRIYRAKDKWKATLVAVSGWAAATAAGAAFAAWWTPADVAGPWAWAGHGAGTLIAGGIGYWIGSEVTRYIYELAVEP